MKILIFSWRDIKYPGCGGAEILTLKLARGWVKSGHKVHLVSAKFQGAKNEEEIEGVKIFRPARFDSYSPFQYCFYLYKTIGFYRQKLAGKYDLVIDQVHGLPFFTPFFVKERVVFFPLEVAKSIWFYEVPFPFSLFGYLLELAYIKIFSNLPFLTISPSTSYDLTNLGVKNVFTITPGVHGQRLKRLPRKSQSPLLISLGRITKMKRLEDTILAFRLLHKELPHIKLVIAGLGKADYLDRLKNLCQTMAIDDRVVFTGFISEKEKIKLLSSAWIIVSTSLREGWGLTVIEAASCGTPSVAYRVAGLVDSVKDGETGFLCRKNNPEELAKNIKKLLINPRLRRKFSQNALDWSRKFSWKKTTQEGLEIFKKITSSRPP
ncbi:MAG: glycosyltransferase family 4 protein, partial [bacterium]|nr:glycosyltransferase family 4 protein [bacterium]